MNSSWTEELDEFRTTQRRTIVEAAERLFLKYGFLQSSMTNIAAEAGISRPTLYKYFPTLDDLALEVQMRSLGRLNETIRKHLVTGQGTALERLGQVFEACLEFYDLNPHWLRFTALFDQYYSQKKAASNGEVKYAAFLQQYSGLDRLIEKGQQEGTIRQDLDPHTTAAMVENTMLAMLQRLAVRGEAISQEQAIVPREQLTQLFSMMLKYLDPGDHS
jgi:AcrR family transcriptional regulator